MSVVFSNRHWPLLFCAVDELVLVTPVETGQHALVPPQRVDVVEELLKHTNHGAGTRITKRHGPAGNRNRAHKRSPSRIGRWRHLQARRFSAAELENPLP